MVRSGALIDVPGFASLPPVDTYNTTAVAACTPPRTETPSGPSLGASAAVFGAGVTSDTTPAVAISTGTKRTCFVFKRISRHVWRACVIAAEL
jgi:hypothetical protein